MDKYDKIYRAFMSGNVAPFYDTLYPGLLVYASRQLGDELAYLAEDCVQDAVMASYTDRRKLPSSYTWYAYILKCIFHSALQIIRKHTSRATYLSKSLSGNLTDELDAAILEQEILDMLAAAIRSLPANYQELLRMSYHEGLKNSEIAERLGLAEITVKKQKAKLIAMLRKRMAGCPPYMLTLLLTMRPEIIH